MIEDAKVTLGDAEDIPEDADEGLDDAEVKIEVALRRTSKTEASASGEEEGE